VKSIDVAAAASPPPATAAPAAPEAAPAESEAGGDSGGDSSSSSSEEKLSAAFAKAMRDAQVAYLRTLAGKPSFAPLFARLEAEGAEAGAGAMSAHLPFQQALLLHAESEARSSAAPAAAAAGAGADREQCLLRVVAAADRCVSLVDATAIALNLGQLVPKGDKAALAARKEVEGRRAELVAALRSKAVALLSLADLAEAGAAGAGAGAGGEFAYGPFQAACRELLKWDDMSAPRFLLINLRKLRIQKR
jgi:hypothetical protein